MKKKVVFILSSIQDSHQTNRVTEFVSEGYNVDVFAFNRKNVKSKNTNFPFEVRIIGEFDFHEPYRNRILKIYNAVKFIASAYRNKSDVVFYYQGLSIAMFAAYMIKSPYIYEECDLLHVSLRNKLLRSILDRIDKNVINRSLLTILTSKGFADYHFGNKVPSNIVFVTNRLQKSILDLPIFPPKEPNINKLDLAFVGSMRYDSIYNFVKVYLENFPQHNFHLFGVMFHDKFRDFEKFPNFFNHGAFRNPDDLPGIYSKLDIVLCAYDSRGINERYAEPNKLYEAIFFEKPIIVSDGTFLAKEVRSMDIGYIIDALDDDSIISFINSINVQSIRAKQINACKIDKETFCINSNEFLFSKINEIVYGS